MPLPKPNKKTQDKSKWMGVCMSNPQMLKEWPDQKNRAAVCYKLWGEKKKKASLSYKIGDEEFIVEDDTSEEPTT